ncbi:MAG: membrane glycosyltransferase, partial [Arcobacteraceae bacterium]
MKTNNIISKEGYKTIGIIFSIAIFLILFISNCIGLIMIIIGFFMMYVYRDTNRYIFSNTQSVLAPIDSTVTAIDKV